MASAFINDINLAAVAFLPVLVTLIAGLIRQDKFPENVNHAITIALAGIVALGQALLNGKLGGSPMADFAIVMAYTTAVTYTPLFQQLQDAVQTATSFGTKKPASVADMPTQYNLPTPQAQPPLQQMPPAQQAPMVQPSQLFYPMPSQQYQQQSYQSPAVPQYRQPGQ